VGAPQEQRRDAMRRQERQFLSDHAPHRKPQDEGPFHAEMIQKTPGVLGKLFHLVRTLGHAGAPRTAVIERNRPVAFAEVGRLPIPGPSPAAEPGYEQQRHPLALNLVVELYFSTLTIWHKSPIADVELQNLDFEFGVWDGAFSTPIFDFCLLASAS